MNAATENFDDSMLKGLRQVPGGVWRTYLAPEAKIVFESVNKNACTSLKWMMADLAGEDLSTFTAGWQPYVDDSEAVHTRWLWKASPRLDDLSREERAEIHPDNGWFIFAVVRDPRLRLFSAWQNRLMIEGPLTQRWKQESWYPRHPLTRESVLEDFATFVDMFDQHPEHWLRAKDAHFRDQVEMIAEDAVPYTRIYEISEMRQLQRDLGEHLQGLGRSPELYMPRNNPTTLHPTAEVFANGVREKIERIYAADFERFGHLWEDFSKPESAEPWTKEALASCEAESALGSRIAELHRMAREERDANEEAHQRIAALEAELASLEERHSLKGQGRRLARAARRGAGRVRRGVQRSQAERPVADTAN